MRVPLRLGRHHLRPRGRHGVAWGHALPRGRRCCPAAAAGGSRRAACGPPCRGCGCGCGWIAPLQRRGQRRAILTRPRAGDGAEEGLHLPSPSPTRPRARPVAVPPPAARSTPCEGPRRERGQREGLVPLSCRGFSRRVLTRGCVCARPAQRECSGGETKCSLERPKNFPAAVPARSRPPAPHVTQLVLRQTCSPAHLQTCSVRSGRRTLTPVLPRDAAPRERGAAPAPAPRCTGRASRADATGDWLARGRGVTHGEHSGAGGRRGRRREGGGGALP